MVLRARLFTSSAGTFWRSSSAPKFIQLRCSCLLLSVVLLIEYFA